MRFLNKKQLAPNSKFPTFSDNNQCPTSINAFILKEKGGGIKTVLLQLLSTVSQLTIPLTINFSANCSCSLLESIPDHLYQLYMPASPRWYDPREGLVSCSLWTDMVPLFCAGVWGWSRNLIPSPLATLLLPQVFSSLYHSLLLTPIALAFIALLFPALHTQKCDPGQSLLFGLEK